MHNLALYLVGEGRSQMDSAYPKGHYLTFNYGDALTNCSEVCSSSSEGSLTLAMDTVRSTVVFNLNADTLGISFPYHL